MGWSVGFIEAHIFFLEAALLQNSGCIIQETLISISESIFNCCFFFYTALFLYNSRNANFNIWKYSQLVFIFCSILHSCFIFEETFISIPESLPQLMLSLFVYRTLVLYLKKRLFQYLKVFLNWCLVFLYTALLFCNWRNANFNI